MVLGPRAAMRTAGHWRGSSPMITRAGMKIISNREWHFVQGPKPEAHRRADGRLLAGVWYNQRRYAITKGFELFGSQRRRQWIDDQGHPLPRNGILARKLNVHMLYRNLGKAEQRCRELGL